MSLFTVFICVVSLVLLLQQKALTSVFLSVAASFMQICFSPGIIRPTKRIIENYHVSILIFSSAVSFDKGISLFCVWSFGCEKSASSCF